MNRMICGITGVLLVAGLAACNDDPGVDLSGPPTGIQASPTVMFIDDGDTEELLLRLVDDANFSVPSGPYTISNVGVGLSVVRDSLYRPDYTTDTLVQPDQLVEQRYLVTANLPNGGARSLTVSQGSISQDITVNVMPVNINSLVFTPNASAVPVTVTAEGFNFTEDFELTIGDQGVKVLAVAADGSNATVVLPAETKGIASASGIYIPPVPAAALSLSSSDTLTTPAAAWNGSMPDGNAPVLTAGEPGTSVTIYDTFVNSNAADAGFWGGPGKYIKLVIPSPGERTITVGWNNDADIDMVITPTTVLNDAVAGALTGDNPETATYDFPAAGTYWIGYGLFAGDAPGILTITVQ